MKINIINSLKKIIPNYILVILREILFRCRGFHEYSLLNQEYDELNNQWTKVLQNSTFNENQTRTALQKNIIFITGYGLGSHYLALEPILINALLLRGAKVSSFYCGKSLPSCEFNKVGNNIPLADISDLKGISDKTNCYACTRCSSNVEGIYKKFDISLNKYSEYIDSMADAAADQMSKSVTLEGLRDWSYEGITLGEDVYATILRATFMGTIPDTSYSRRLVSRYVKSAVLMYHATMNRFKKDRPDRVVLIHGIYQTHGIPVKVANQLNIPVVVVGGGGIRKDTAVFCHGETYHHQLIKEPNSLWESQVVSLAEEKRVLEYARGKKNLGASQDYFAYHPNPNENIDLIIQELNLPKDKPVIAIYTNVIWDAQILYKSNVFEDIFDWVFQTIDEIKKNEDVVGVIRIHPGEAKGANPTRQPMLPEILKRYPDGLPNNIRIVPSESNISSYTLAELSTHTVIYGTKMGLELALMRVPVIICGETFSRNKGYGLDINTIEQYKRFLSNPEIYSPDLNKNYDIALRYANYFYFKRMLDMPFRSSGAGKAGGGIKLEFNSLDNLALHSDKNIDLICDGIIDLKQFYVQN
jgi:hypothetical protein